MSKNDAERGATIHLANLLRRLVNIAPGQPANLDISAAKFAEARHRAGPFLHILSKQGRVLVDSETAAFLQNSYRHAGLFVARQQQARQLVAQTFDDADVPFFEFKGRGLAEQLYEHPTVRFSKDIDILVPKKDRSHALQTLWKKGFLRNANGERFNRTKAALAMWSRKDSSLYDPEFGQQIELHQRLFAAEPKNFTEHFIASVRSDGTPRISNSYYILYLILHGAHAHWTSLRRMLDIPVLLNKVSAGKASETFDLAKKYHSTSAVSASIRFVDAIFPDCIDDIWLDMADRFRTGKSKILEKSFDRTLCSSPFSVRRTGFPVPEWYIYDGGINYVREAPKRVMRIIANRM